MKKKTPSAEVLWIKENRQFLNVNEIARQVGVPTKTFFNFCNDVHSLNKEWWPGCVKLVRKLGVVIEVKEKKQPVKTPSVKVKPESKKRTVNSNYLEQRRKLKQ